MGCSFPYYHRQHRLQSVVQYIDMHDVATRTKSLCRVSKIQTWRKLAGKSDKLKLSIQTSGPNSASPLTCYCMEKVSTLRTRQIKKNSWLSLQRKKTSKFPRRNRVQRHLRNPKKHYLRVNGVKCIKMEWFSLYLCILALAAVVGWISITFLHYFN